MDIIIGKTPVVKKDPEKNPSYEKVKPESVRYPGFSLKIVGREKISTPRPPKIYILPAYCW